MNINNSLYLGKRGYIIKKKDLSNILINEIKKDLTVKPRVNTDYGEVAKPFPVYGENKNKLYVPKFYGIKKLGKPTLHKLPVGQNINLNFKLKLREVQKEPAKKMLTSYKKNGGGILSLKCGAGKTILALYFISVLKKKTLVIVHKEFLLDQWKERIKMAFPKCRIGIIQQNKFEVENKDIVIGMLQTLSMKEFALGAFDSFGHVIVDECHRIPSRVFSRALKKINSTYMLGLSATPNRKDGLTKIIKWYLGDIIKQKNKEELVEVLVKRIITTSKNEDYNKELVNYRGIVKISTMINNIAYYLLRTKTVISIIKNIFSENKDRQILILSDRKKQLNDFYNLIINDDICTVGYYIGGMKSDARKESETKQLLLGTYQMAKEGLDIKSLNCLILATPKSDIIQSIGRILRQKHAKLVPLIIDIVDNFSIFRNQAKKRLKVYQKRKYNIVNITYDIDKNQKLKEVNITHIGNKKEKKILKKNTSECMFSSA